MTTYNTSSSYNRTFQREVIGGGDPTIRVMSSSPLHTIKTTLGGFPASDLSLGSTSFVQPHNYHFGTATSGSFQSSDDYLSASMDVSAFTPEELKVSIVGNQVVVEGKHAEKKDALGSIERQFTRKFTLPRNAHPDTVQSNLTGDGMLTVTATAPKIKENSPSRTIPIKVINTNTGTANASASASSSSQASPGQQQQNGTQPQNGR